MLLCEALLQHPMGGGTSCVHAYAGLVACSGCGSCCWEGMEGGVGAPAPTERAWLCGHQWVVGRRHGAPH